MATAGLVGTICGLYHTSTSGDPQLLNEGFAATFARRLMGMPGCDGPVRRGRTFVLPYSPFAFACLADELTAAAGDLDVYLQAWCTTVETRARRIEALCLSTWEGGMELVPRLVVDTSGDAIVAHAAGAATVTPPAAERQFPSLVFVLQQVDTGALGGGARVALLRTLRAAEQEGRLPRGASHLALGPSVQPGEVVCKLALECLASDGPGRRPWLTAAEQEGRRRALAVATFLKTLPPFARAFVSHAAAQVGVRESRRLVGRYTLTCEDVLGGRRFDDGVARASWPIELWEEGHAGASYAYLDDGQTYDIPLRSLEAREPENLLVAGRCMSATHEALGSARVIGTCLAAGEAAGRAAARQASGGRREDGEPAPAADRGGPRVR
jgi:hypothetical protein